MGSCGSCQQRAPQRWWRVPLDSRPGAILETRVCHGLARSSCAQVVFFDGRLPFCLLGLGKKSKDGFLISWGVPFLGRHVFEDKASLDLLHGVGFKTSTSDLLPALPSGLADKRALIKVAAKLLRDWF